MLRHCHWDSTSLLCLGQNYCVCACVTYAVTDASNLFQSDEMVRFIGSTFHVAQNVLDCILWKPVTSCIEIPRNLATNVISAVHNNANGFIQTCFLIPDSFIPLAMQHVVNPIAVFLKDHTFPILGWHSPPDSASILNCNTNIRDSTNRKVLLMMESSSNSNIMPHRQRHSAVYYIRAYDLNFITSEDLSHNSNGLESHSLLRPMTVSGPLGHNDNEEIAADWIAFSCSGDANAKSLAIQALDALCLKALQYVVLDEDISAYIRPTNTNDSLGIIQWNPENGTKNRLELIRKKPYDDRLSILEKEVLVWTGTIFRNDSNNGCNKSSFGNNVPLVRGRGIISGMSPLALVKLLLDSNQVKCYNRWSNGRTDVCVYQDLFDSDGQEGGDFGVGISKIVKSESNLGIIQKKLTLTTLMHARKLMIKGGNEEPIFLMVSRSAHKERQQHPLDNKDNHDDELLIGVNLIQAVQGHPDKTELISVSHMKCSMVPGFLQKKIAIGGIKEFYDRLRNL